MYITGNITENIFQYGPPKRQITYLSFLQCVVKIISLQDKAHIAKRIFLKKIISDYLTYLSTGNRKRVKCVAVSAENRYFVSLLKKDDLSFSIKIKYRPQVTPAKIQNNIVPLNTVLCFYVLTKPSHFEEQK